MDPVILNLFTYCWLWRKGNRRKLTTKSSFDTFYGISSLYIIYSKYSLVLHSLFMHNIHVFHTVCETWLLRSMGVVQSRKMNGPLVFRKQLLAMLIKVQHDAAICRHLFSVTLLYMFRVSRTHHQEYQKLYLLPLVYVMSHNGTVTSCLRGLILPRRQEVTVPLRDMTYTSGSRYSF